MLRKIISAIIIAIADVLRGNAGPDPTRMSRGVPPWRIDSHRLPAPHHQSEEGRIAMRACLAAVWRVMRWLAAFTAFCQMLFDLIKEVRNTVQNQRRADMCVDDMV